MIPLSRPVLGFQVAVAAYLPSREEDVAQFEKAFATFSGQKYAIAFPYGRTGLALLLEAMGIQNKEILCPAYTCIVIPNAIVTSKNEPVFVDSGGLNFNMDLDLALEAVTNKTAAIVPTSLFGYPVDIDALDSFREKHPKIKVIQDCSHSFHADWGGKKVHKEADATIFSFNIGKIVHSIFGGMITTDQESLAKSLRTVRKKRLSRAGLAKAWKRRAYLAALYPAFWTYGITHTFRRLGVLARWLEIIDPQKIQMPPDYLEALTGVEARVGLVQLDKYLGVIEQRREETFFYHKKLQGLEGFNPPALMEGATYSHAVATTGRRDELLDYAISRGVELGKLFDYCVPETEAYHNRQGSSGSYPVARLHSETVVNLPCGSSLQAQHKTVSVIKEFFARTME